MSLTPSWLEEDIAKPKILLLMSLRTVTFTKKFQERKPRIFKGYKEGMARKSLIIYFSIKLTQ